MNKRRAVLALSLAILGFIVAFMVILTTMRRQSGPATPGGPEVTIRNTTASPVTFTLTPQKSGAKGRSHKLAAGRLDRFPAPEPLDLTYLDRVLELSYTLVPGRHYTFRTGRGGKVEFWQGSHGVAGAPDLAPFVVTPDEVVAKMLEMAGTTKDSLVYDLGCGDGRVVIAAARTYGARGVGIDIEPQRVDESRANAVRAGVESLLEFRCEDVLKADISPASVVTVYFLPDTLALVRPKLELDLKPGTPVVSHNYAIPGWESRKVASAGMTAADGREHTVILYRR